jgi:predicted nucleic acid-binding protein
MDKVVIDTSVIVKWFVQESDTTKAQNILEQQKNNKIQIILPDVVLLELINALYWGKKIPYRNIVKALKAMSKIRIIYKKAHDSLLLTTLSLMTKHKIQSYDALFIALAEQEKCPLITADYKHHKKRFSKRIKYLA